jgi:hypothetical protein
VQEDAKGSEIMGVSAQITNLANSFVVATCSINMPVEMLLLDNDEKSVLLPSGGKSQLSWRISSPGGLSTQWLHTMPIEISCFPGTTVKKEIQIDPRSANSLFANASIQDLTVINSSTASVKVLNEGTKPLSDLSITLCLIDGVDACFNKTITNLPPGEIAYTSFSGFNLTEGDRVSAQLNSAEMESSRVEATLRDLTEPELPEETAEKEAAMPSTLFNAQNPVLQGSKANEETALMIGIAVMALALMAVFVSVLRKK